MASTSSMKGMICSIGIFFETMGMMTAWVGATRGGSTSPASSACVITSAPSSRVETPQLVAHTSSRVLPAERKGERGIG